MARRQGKREDRLVLDEIPEVELCRTDQRVDVRLVDRHRVELHLVGDEEERRTRLEDAVERPVAAVARHDQPALESQARCRSTELVDEAFQFVVERSVDARHGSRQARQRRNRNASSNAPGAVCELEHVDVAGAGGAGSHGECGGYTGSRTCRAPMTRIVLASTSPYRRELLARLRVPFTVTAPDVDETPRPGEPPLDTARRLALAKAHAVAARDPEAIVIGSDQVADVDGSALSKPGTHAAALAQLRALRGRSIVFHTAVALVRGEHA